MKKYILILLSLLVVNLSAKSFYQNYAGLAVCEESVTGDSRQVFIRDVLATATLFYDKTSGLFGNSKTYTTVKFKSFVAFVKWVANYACNNEMSGDAAVIFIMDKLLQHGYDIENDELNRKVINKVIYKNYVFYKGKVYPKSKVAKLKAKDLVNTPSKNKVIMVNKFDNSLTVTDHTLLHDCIDSTTNKKVKCPKGMENTKTPVPSQRCGRVDDDIFK